VFLQVSSHERKTWELVPETKETMQSALHVQSTFLDM